MLLIFAFDTGGFKEVNSVCVCERVCVPEACYTRYPIKGPPQLRRQTGNCTAFSQFRLFLLPEHAVLLVLSYQTEVPCFGFFLLLFFLQPPPPNTSYKFTHSNSADIIFVFPYCSPSFAPFPSLQVPEWASLVDHTGGGVVLLWCLGSFKEPSCVWMPVIQP